MTLPVQGQAVTFSFRESAPFSPLADTGSLTARLFWDTGFRPDEIQEVSSADGTVRGFRVIDANEKTATLRAESPIELINDKGRLVIRVALPDRKSRDFGAITGQVVDDHDRPIAGVKVGMTTGGFHVSSELRHQSTTNAEGQYRLREIPRRAIDGRRLELQILLAKEGYASFVSPSLTLKENATEKLELVEPIRLERGGSMSGIVVDHRGQPVAGARVLTSLDVRYRGLDDHMARVRTDEKGRFTIRDLPRGSTRLIASDGKTSSSTIHLRLGNSNPVVCLQLPESRPRRDLPLKDRVARSEPLRMGQAALEWQVGQLVRRPNSRARRRSG